MRFRLGEEWRFDLSVRASRLGSSPAETRQWLLAQQAVTVLAGVVEEARRQRLLSEDHFRVDGKLMDA